MSHLVYRKPARMRWKSDAPKTSHCLVRILTQKYNWAIFLRKWTRSGRYSQWRLLSGQVEWIFFHKNWRGGYWQHLDGAMCHTDEATLDVLLPVFEDRITSRKADNVWPSRNCNLTPLDYYLWGAIKDKCYTDKPETIDA